MANGTTTQATLVTDAITGLPWYQYSAICSVWLPRHTSALLSDLTGALRTSPGPAVPFIIESALYQSSMRIEQRVGAGITEGGPEFVTVRLNDRAAIQKLAQGLSIMRRVRDREAVAGEVKSPSRSRSAVRFVVGTTFSAHGIDGLTAYAMRSLMSGVGRTPVRSVRIECPSTGVSLAMPGVAQDTPDVEALTTVGVAVPFDDDGAVLGLHVSRLSTLEVFGHEYRGLRGVACAVDRARFSLEDVETDKVDEMVFHALAQSKMLDKLALRQATGVPVSADHPTVLRGWKRIFCIPHVRTLVVDGACPAWSASDNDVRITIADIERDEMTPRFLRTIRVTLVRTSLARLDV